MEALPGAKATTPVRLQGQYADEETGLSYNRWRYYDGDGAFVSADPLGIAPGAHSFSFAVNAFTWSDPEGLWNKHKQNGQFAKKPGPKTSTPPSGHGNSLSSQKETHLYAKFDAQGNFLKWGITDDVNGRYSSVQLNGGKLVPVAKGSRQCMAALERELTERDPGPDNLEPWAGSKRGQPYSPAAQKARARAGRP